MRSIWGWAAGKKTYLLAGLVMLTILVLVFLGKLTPETASAVALFALSGFAVTFRSALANHQAEVVAILKGIAQIGAAHANGSPGKAMQALAAIAPQGIKLAQELNAEGS